MSRVARWISLLAVFVVVGLAGAYVPGFGGPAEEGHASDVVLGELVRQLVDPLVLAVALVAALIAGRWRGLRAAGQLLWGRTATIEARDYRSVSRLLAAAGRGLLWGSFVANTAYVVCFYLVIAGVLETGPTQRLDYVKAGALVVVPFGALLLLPLARAAGHAAGVEPSRAARTFDLVAVLGLMACTLITLLSLFVYRHPVIGQPGTGRTHVWPTAEGLDASFVLWSIALVAIISALAFAPTFRSTAPERGRAWMRTCLFVGVFVATLVEVAGLNEIARTGGQGDPSTLQSLAGRMLFVIAVAIVIGGVARAVPAIVRSRGSDERLASVP